jgi:hypothetical protein
MKKYLIAITAPIAYLALTASAFADTAIGDPCSTSGQFNPLCGLSAKNLGGFIGSIVQLIFVIAILVALVYLVYGGFRWLVSSGDKSQVASAREHLVAAVIGLVIIFLSYFILNLLLGFFGLGGLGTLSIPTIKFN